MKLIEMIKLEFKLLLSRKEFFYTFTIMMVLISIGFLSKCFSLYGRDIAKVYPASQLWFGWISDFSKIARLISELFYMFALPFIASLAYSDTYFIDYNTRMIKNIIIRCNKKDYIISKTVVVFASGFIVIFLPLVIEQILCFFVAPVSGRFDILHTKAYQFPYIKAMQFPVLFINYPYLSNFLFAVIAGMFGACISLVSYSISFINKKSRLLVVAIPGIVYVVYNFIVEFLNMRHLSLLNYLYSCVTFVGNTSYLLKVMAGMIIISGIIILGRNLVVKDEL